jgi:hypothetical protein
MKTIAGTENVCSTVADELLAAQLESGQVCSTVADELLAAQLESGQICSTVVDELLEEQLRRERAPRGA